ncbi:hypothetical protein L1987_23440 [Smallanthus sonchifolius]|uniref:Uncharacterized protein n=1 Tax=Smallanthus sonchifolius TaxID=185202 RepID=A0ACB9IHM8_9ASTR|nr:hypothetical protein L1987_23440 [Smallanthus sonchifolius]
MGTLLHISAEDEAFIAFNHEMDANSFQNEREGSKRHWFLLAGKKLKDWLVKLDAIAKEVEVELISRDISCHLAEVLEAVNKVLFDSMGFKRSMMIVVEFLPNGDLGAYLKRKGALRPLTTLKYAMDIAGGMSYLHENMPEPIIHKDLKPSKVLILNINISIISGHIPSLIYNLHVLHLVFRSGINSSPCVWYLCTHS